MRLTPVTILLVVAVLLAAAAGGDDVDSMRLVLDDEHTLEGPVEALLVAGGEVTTTGPVAGPTYVADGTLRVEGTVAGDLVVLSGNATVADGARVDGTVRALGGDVRIADGASVGAVERGVPATGDGVGPADRLVGTALLAAVAALFVARRPGPPATVGDALTAHPLVSGVVGALSALLALAVVVLLAFTVLLLPLSLLALVVGALVVGYALVAYGVVVGRRLPVERPPVAAAAGVVVVQATLWLLGRVPVVGALAALALVLAGVGAVLVTGFGLRRFEPPTLE